MIECNISMNEKGKTNANEIEFTQAIEMSCTYPEDRLEDK